MTYERVTIVLTEHEMQALRNIAQQELRRPRDQAAYILRNVLSVSDSVKKNNRCDAKALTGQNITTVAGINP